jgi:hypothetical protein
MQLQDNLQKGLGQHEQMLQVGAIEMQKLSCCMFMQAAATSSAWQQQLSAMPAATLASVLPLSTRRYSRLQQVADCGQQGRRTMRGILKMSVDEYESFVSKHLQQQQQQQQQQEQQQQQQASAAGAAGLQDDEEFGGSEGMMSVTAMQRIADGLAVSPAKITIYPLFVAAAAAAAATAGSRSAGNSSSSSSTGGGDGAAAASSSSIVVTGIRLRYGTADVSLRKRALTHDTLCQGLVRLCCCYCKRHERFHLTAEQCARIRGYVPADKWELYVACCRHPRML